MGNIGDDVLQPSFSERNVGGKKNCFKRKRNKRNILRLRSKFGSIKLSSQINYKGWDWIDFFVKMELFCVILSRDHRLQELLNLWLPNKEISGTDPHPFDIELCSAFKTQFNSISHCVSHFKRVQWHSSHIFMDWKMSFL